MGEDIIAQKLLTFCSSLLKDIPERSYEETRQSPAAPFGNSLYFTSYRKYNEGPKKELRKFTSKMVMDMPLDSASLPTEAFRRDANKVNNGCQVPEQQPPVSALLSNTSIPLGGASAWSGEEKNASNMVLVSFPALSPSRIC